MANPLDLTQLLTFKYLFRPMLRGTVCFFGLGPASEHPIAGASVWDTKWFHVLPKGDRDGSVCTFRNERVRDVDVLSEESPQETETAESFEKS
ncbi:MAG: hypothetical protein J6D36_00965 [Erysipelotrichaceae bacterium]|nr:hypothetical protein [Erysipelotrichaceae bacterium]